MSNQVWYPKRSLTADECEEGGRGSRKLLATQVSESKTLEQKRVKIVRRKQPTVDTREAASRAIGRGARERDGLTRGQEKSYATIENQTHASHRSLILAHSGPESRPQRGAEFVGWVDNESLSRYSGRERVSVTAAEGMDRINVRTPSADGGRGSVASRANSRCSARISGRRRQHYEFRHFQHVHDYIDHYRELYCYTTLAVPAQVECSHIKEREMEGGGGEEEEMNNYESLGVKCLYQGDPYLQELAARLGVRASLREQQLLRSPRPTPASIVKKHKHTMDLQVCPNGKREEAVQTPGEKAAVTESSTEKTSRPSSRGVQEKEKKLVAPHLELPTIHEAIAQRQIASRRRRHQTDSTISVGKYLQVSSQGNHNPGEKEKEKETETNRNTQDTTAESTHSLPEVPTSSQSLISSKSAPSVEKEEEEEEEEMGVLVKPRFPPHFSLQEQLPLLDDAQKEKLISRKAHSLGIISRDWSKTPHVKRIVGSYQREKSKEAAPLEKSRARPHTQREGEHGQDKAEHRTRKTEEIRHSLEKKRAHDRKKEVHQHTSIAKSSPREAQEHKSKIERLNSVYSVPSDSTPERKRNRGKLHSNRSHRCESRAASRPPASRQTASRPAASRPATRMASRSKDQSRPSTRLAITRDWQDLRRCMSIENSRAPTRMTLRDVPKELEGSQYFNEITPRPATQQSHAHQRRREPNGDTLREANLHSTALAMRLRRPPRSGRGKTRSDGSSEPLPPGSSPQQISAHYVQLREKFVDLLEIQQRNFVSSKQ